jgi:F0F1-type ATP synthase assembly protein I
MPDMPVGFIPGRSKIKHVKQVKRETDEPERKEKDKTPTLTSKEAAEKAIGYVHPYAATALTISAFVAGFIFSWVVLHYEGSRGIGLLFSIILIWAVRWPIKAWAAWAANAGNREEWITEQIEKEIEKDKNAGKREITEEDFDRATLDILKKTIKKARKDKTTVSVPFLLQELAKNIR